MSAYKFNTEIFELKELNILCLSLIIGNIPKKFNFRTILASEDIL